MMVSFSVSPLVLEVTFGSVNPMTRAPRRLAAVSNERRVRVEGSKEECGYDASIENFAVRMAFKFVRHLHEVKDFLSGEAGNAY